MIDALITPGGIMRLLALTVRDPAEAARMLLSLHLSRGVLWQALALVTIVSVLVVALSPGPMPDAATAEGTDALFLSPFAYATILGASLVILVFALHFTGAALGGTGSFAGTLTLVTWLEVLATAVRVVQVVTLLVAPVAAGIVSIAGLVLLFWTLVNFIRVLHGFDTLGRAILTLLLAIAGMSVGLMLILGLIGVGVAGGPFDV
jgi:hypothetical protein